MIYFINIKKLIYKLEFAELVLKRFKSINRDYLNILIEIKTKNKTNHLTAAFACVYSDYP